MNTTRRSFLSMLAALPGLGFLARKREKFEQIVRTQEALEWGRLDTMGGIGTLTATSKDIQKARDDLLAGRLQTIEWIPVTERLPEFCGASCSPGRTASYDSKLVLMVELLSMNGAEPFVSTGRFHRPIEGDGDSWWENHYGGRIVTHITHWAELPKPPGDELTTFKHGRSRLGPWTFVQRKD